MSMFDENFEKNDEIREPMSELAGDVIESMVKSGHLSAEINPDDGSFDYQLTPLGFMFEQFVSIGIFLTNKNPKLAVLFEELTNQMMEPT